jgi:hypothetical protein
MDDKVTVSKGSALQIRVSAQQQAAFRAYAAKRNTTMSALVLGWVEAALSGRDGELPGAASPPAVGAPGRQEELLAELVSETKLQTALLERLLEGQGSGPVSPLGDGPAAPAGGDVEADG